MFSWTEKMKENAKNDFPYYTYHFEIDTDEKELLEDLKHVVFGMAERFGNEFAKIYGEMKTENGITNWKLTTKDRMVAGFLEIACEICKDRSDQNRETQRPAKGGQVGEVTIEVKTEGLDETLKKAKELRCELEAARELAKELDKSLDAYKN